MRVGVRSLLTRRSNLAKRIPFQFRSFSSSSCWNSIPIPILGPDLPDVWVPGGDNRHHHSSGLHSNGQTAKLMDGKFIAKYIKAEIASQIREMKAAIGKTPGLAVVPIGKRRDSHTFIRIKLKACDEVRIATMAAELPDDCTEDEVLDVVSSFNRNPSVHGIIVQLPLLKHLDEEKVINFALLLWYGVEIIGKKAVVIGRSKIVGMPTSSLVQRHHATASTVHPFTKNPEQITCEADIVVSDVGTPNIVRGDWLNPGATVIDTGTNSVKDPSSSQDFRITGDVCYEEAARVVSAITPVPRSIGPRHHLNASVNLT